MSNFEMRECTKHGNQKFYKRDRWRCAKCATEAVTKRRKNLKLMAVEYLGGQCQFCGYSKCVGAMDFHHKDPKEKDFGIAQKGYTRSWEKVKSELDKCLLLCKNCHNEEHERLNCSPVA